MTAHDSSSHSDRRLLQATALALLLSLSACVQADGSGVTDTAVDPGLLPAMAIGCSEESTTGNGVSGNGLSGNGLCGNGLGASGLTTANLSTAGFASWFNANPDLASMVVRYVYKCAAPSGKSITWTNPTTNVQYTWAGGLGLAPGWVSGAAATVAEQQLVTACLGALVNKYGVSVTIAVEGRTATGQQIPVGPTELATYSVKEACFFGNLFTSEGVYVGLDHWPWDARTSSVRACAMDKQSEGPSLACPPLFQVDSCHKYCTPDRTHTFYESCSYNGITYKPLTTRLNPADVYKCGDGVCQFTESCGTGTDADDCNADCGVCR
jgi:hypothetical protein